MVDSERVLRLLAGLIDDVGSLSRLGARRDLRADGDALAAVKYRFITAFEGVARVAHHIVVSEGWGVPETNADAVRMLATHGVIEESLAASLRAGMGFRNLLVHRYGDVDDDRVVGFLDRLDDLRRYAAQVTRWIRHPED